MYLATLFSHHPPKGDQAARYARIREQALELAELIKELTPGSAEQTLAIRALHLAVMHANSAIALNE